MQTYLLNSGKSTQFHGSSYGGAAELRGDVVAWLACLTLSLHQSPQDVAGGGCTSSSTVMAQARTLLHHGKLKRGMWRHMRCLRECTTSVWLTPSTLRFPTPVHGHIPLPH